MTNKRKGGTAEKQRRGGGFRMEAQQEELGPIRRVGKNTPITIPTGDVRHMSHIRDGKLVYDQVFAHDRIKLLPVDKSAVEEGKTDNASKKQATAKVGVRGKGSSVGKTPALQSAKKEINTKSAAQRKKTRVTKQERKHGPGRKS